MTTAPSTESMTAVAVTGRREFTTLELPVPTCGPHDVLVKVAYTGICGSDVPRFFDGAVHSTPQVLGHEFSGVVADVGAEVDSVRPGARVTVAPLVPCHACDQCTAGRPSLCPDYSFVGSRQQGAFADYVCVPAANVVPVGDLSLRRAALVEPLTVALHALRLAGEVQGRDVAVLGGGVIGLMTVLGLRELGANDITVVDISPWALQMATGLGATAVIDARDGDLHDRLAGANAPGLVVETAGAAATQRQSIEIAGKNAAVVLVGTPSADLTLPSATVGQILRKELLVRGSWMSYSAPFPGSEWSDAVRILGDRNIDAESLISHEYSLADIEDGFEVMRERDVRRLKVMFRLAGEES